MNTDGLQFVAGFALFLLLTIRFFVKQRCKSTQCGRLGQFRQLWPELTEPCKAVVQVIVLTGLRIGEILALRWNRIDLTFRIRGKGCVPRVVLFSYCRTCGSFAS